METITNGGCEMVTSYVINPARNDEWWLTEQVANYVPPTGYSIAEPNDYFVMRGIIAMNFDLDGYGVMFNIDGVDSFQTKYYGFTYHWCKSGDITSVKLKGNNVSWAFNRKAMPNGSPNTYCKFRLVKSHAPKIVLTGFSERHADSMTKETLAYYLGTAVEPVPALPQLLPGMNENITIPTYYLGLSVYEIRQMIQKEQNLHINMIWTQDEQHNLYWVSGRYEGVNVNYYHFEKDTLYKILVG